MGRGVGAHRFSTYEPDDVLELSFEHGGRLHPDQLATCAGCRHKTEEVFESTGETHRINRSGEPAKPGLIIGLCCHCWGELLRD